MLDKINDPPYFVHHKDRFWVGMMFIVYIEEMMFRTKFGNEIYWLHLLFHKDFLEYTVFPFKYGAKVGNEVYWLHLLFPKDFGVHSISIFKRPSLEIFHKC